MDSMDDINMTITSEISGSFKDFNKLKVDDFTILKVIGKGSYGKVVLVKKRDNEEILAMKILKKKDLTRAPRIS